MCNMTKLMMSSLFRKSERRVKPPLLSKSEGYEAVDDEVGNHRGLAKERTFTSKKNLYEQNPIRD
jgi:hypothetical protein